VTTKTAENLAMALGGKRSGSGWMARCPAHDDRNPSLALSDGTSGVLWHCHAGCTQEAVSAALREMGLLPEAPAGRKSGFSTPQELAVWLARKSNASVTRIDLYSPTFAEVRLDSSGGKTYRPIHRLPDGGWKTGDLPGKLPLYQVDQLPTDPEILILVVEGPKCVEAARTIGIFATTSPHGAQSARKADWSPLARRQVIVWPDHDDPGRKYAADVRTILEGLGANVQVLDPARFGLRPGEDLADWVNHHPDETPDLTTTAKTDAPFDNEWMAGLDRSQTSKLIPNARSLGLILRNDPKFSSLRFNEFSGVVCHDDGGIDEALLFRWREYVETEYGRGCVIPETVFRNAVEAVAREHRFHPVRDWLESLRWDGTSRIDRLVPTYFGGKDTEYTRAVGKNFLVGAVARIMQPGCKLDTMPVFEGPQGILKSSSVAALFGEDWTAEMKSDLHHKDFEGSLAVIVKQFVVFSRTLPLSISGHDWWSFDEGSRSLSP